MSFFIGGNMNLISVVLQILIGGSLGFLFLYFKKKGENLATKEDVEVITKKVESIKHEYSTALESIRGEISSRLYVHQTRYQNEFIILKDLSEKLVELRDAVQSLRPQMDSYDGREPEEIRKGKRLTRYSEASKQLYKLYESMKPFYPNVIYQAIFKLNELGWKEAVQYQHGDRVDQGYWKEANDNASAISDVANNALDLIRKRVEFWEKFDFKDGV